MFTIIVCAGCEAITNSKSQDPLSLTETSWNLELMKIDGDDISIPKNDPLKIVFKPDSSIEGFGGGNKFYGAYSIGSAENSIEIKLKGMTYAAITPSNSMVFSFMEGLEESESYTIDNNKLEIIFNTDNIFLFSSKE